MISRAFYGALLQTVYHQVHLWGWLLLVAHSFHVTIWMALPFLGSVRHSQAWNILNGIFVLWSCHCVRCLVLPALACCRQSALQLLPGTGAERQGFPTADFGAVMTRRVLSLVVLSVSFACTTKFIEMRLILCTAAYPIYLNNLGRAGVSEHMLKPGKYHIKMCVILFTKSHSLQLFGSSN